MGEWFYGTGSIVFENQIENDYYLIEDIISRYVDKKLFYNTTFSYIREISNLKPFEETTRYKGNKKYSKYDLGFKRNANEEAPLKIKGIHIMYTSENFAFTKPEYLKLIKGLHSVFSIKQATFIFESNLGFKETINLFSDDLIEFDSDSDYKNTSHM
ncbi:hypothetical protein [Sutterella wadsworthensis]|uniref:hypothetical protein n=1 Tax=Sutterella wadsworthensis TaxID=40545 RepID=UPI0032BFA2D2